MMNNEKKTDPLEVAVHLIVMLVGIIVLFIAHNLTDTFWQSLTINVGSSLIIVTIVFGIFEIFRRRRFENASIDNAKNSAANELMEQLRKNQYNPSSLNDSKVVEKK